MNADDRTTTRMDEKNDIAAHCAGDFFFARVPWEQPTFTFVSSMSNQRTSSLLSRAADDS